VVRQKDKPVGKRSGRSKPSFDEGIEQLESILDEIESGEATLEQCLKSYEQGVKLVEHCKSILDKAQQRIAELTPEAPAEQPADAEWDSDRDVDVSDNMLSVDEDT